MKLPVKYDESNMTIDDAEGNVLFQLSWQGVKKSEWEIHDLGREAVAMLNRASVKTEPAASVKNPWGRAGKPK